MMVFRYSDNSTRSAAVEIPQGGGTSPRRLVGVIFAPLAFAWFLWGWAPVGTTPEMRSVAALAATMAILWVCETIPLAATALLPLALLPVLGASTPSEAATEYSGDLIFLFIGGFIIANAVERWGLHQRLAVVVLSLAGTSQKWLVAGTMAVTAFISLWISNTAAALLMLPVGLSIVNACEANDGDHDRREIADLAAAMVLGITTAATIGGMGTPIGSTPNLIFVNTVERLYGIDVGFAQWMSIGLPLVVLFTIGAWWLFTYVMFHLDEGCTLPEREVLVEMKRSLGPMKSGEIVTGVICSLTGLAWILREPRSIGPLTFGLSEFLPGITDGTIAITSAIVLFAMPVSWKPLGFALDWERGGKIPWDIVLLLGGGLSLANAIERSGLGGHITQALSSIHDAPPWMVLILVCLLCVGLSEVASNTATAALLLPLMGTLAVATGQKPMFLMLPVAFATSLGFMLPAATPPNALALGSGRVSVQQLLRAGLFLNLVGIMLLIGLLYLLGFRVFDAIPS